MLLFFHEAFKSLEDDDNKGETAASPSVRGQVLKELENISLQFTCRNCGDRGRVAIYRPFGEVSLSLSRTVTCMVLKANDRRTSCPCHDEFRGPRSDYVRQTSRNLMPDQGSSRTSGIWMEALFYGYFQFRFFVFSENGI
ncbi:uncharacterized protein TNCV_397871 [Trichonephila clavipes]|nr:uncharacterized protein TNCV_397871 [Trichonephila clavipes]